MPASWTNHSENPLRRLSKAELRQHRLFAFAASRHWLPKVDCEEGLAVLRENAKREFLQQTVLQELGDALNRTGLQAGLLKGAALQKKLYRPGERVMSDIDLFVEPDLFEDLLKLLNRLGFAVSLRSHSPLSGFKCVLESASHPNVNIEVHSKLSWLQPAGFKWKWQPSGIGLSTLTPEDQLLHLCGHWVSQHTMLLLSWLVDILMLLEKHGDRVDWLRLQNRARQLSWQKSLMVSLDVARKHFGFTQLPLLAQASIPQITWNFLRDPYADRARYYWIKHRVQDSLAKALWYDAAWLVARGD